MGIPVIVVSRVKKTCGSSRNSDSTSIDSESQPLFPSDIQIQNRGNPYCCLFLIFLLLMFIVGGVVGAGIFFLNSDGKNTILIVTIINCFIAKYLYIRCLMVSTNQADPGCLYFRIS